MRRTRRARTPRGWTTNARRLVHVRGAAGPPVSSPAPTVTRTVETCVWELSFGTVYSCAAFGGPTGTVSVRRPSWSARPARACGRGGAGGGVGPPPARAPRGRGGPRPPAVGPAGLAVARAHRQRHPAQVARQVPRVVSAPADLLGLAQPPQRAGHAA